MIRRLIWISIALSAAGLVWGQRGRGVGAGGQGTPPTLPSQSNAAATRNGAAKTPAQKPSTAQSAKATTAAKDWTTRLTADSALGTRLTPLLPEGATLAGAAEGFRNQGQFIAALHVSKNLNIPFADLKARMTGAEPVSLGKAIQALRPDLDKTAAEDDVKLAERQAKQDSRGK
jgi:hypothetical protein